MYVWIYHPFTHWRKKVFKAVLHRGISRSPAGSGVGGSHYICSSVTSPGFCCWEFASTPSLFVWSSTELSHSTPITTNPADEAGAHMAAIVAVCTHAYTNTPCPLPQEGPERWKLTLSGENQWRAAAAGLFLCVYKAVGGLPGNTHLLFTDCGCTSGFLACFTLL